ncbi:hypothetical protein [Streptomyces sp. NPDC014744]|uniref:hypothetical protein n=1 Tax=Streptomyces sp. NPDC014744 TaxID=3364903 RepID=UPI0036FCBC67
MVDWAQMRDCWFEVDRVPEPLERVERGDVADTWKELGWRLVLEHDLVSPASFAALPRLVCLAPRSAKARALAGEILGRAAGHHDCDDLLAERAGAIAQFREVLNRHLRSRPTDYLVSFLSARTLKLSSLQRSRPGGDGLSQKSVMVEGNTSGTFRSSWPGDAVDGHARR